MIQAFVLIEAEPGRIQELVGELAGMKLFQTFVSIGGGFCAVRSKLQIVDNHFAHGRVVIDNEDVQRATRWRRRFLGRFRQL